MAPSSTPRQIAAHESPRTTKLYDRTKDQITLHEIERHRDLNLETAPINNADSPATSIRDESNPVKR